jgi:DNA-binding CsgD family transcriptional regulator
MLHLLFLYFLLVYTVGFAALIALSVAYSRARTRLIRAYGVFYLAFTLKVVLSGLEVYLSVNLPDPAIAGAVQWIDIGTTFFFSCTIVYVLGRFFSPPWSRFIEWGFYALALALLVLTVRQPALSSGPAYLLLAAASLYSLVISIVSLKDAEAREREFATIMIVGLSTFTPLIFLPLFLEEQLLPIFGPVPFQLVTFPLFYCYNGVLFARHFLRRYGRAAPAPTGTGDSIESLRFGEYGLSDREIEVIALVASGESNKAIGEKLFISVPTVKKHLHNVFEKMGVTTRYQLIRRFTRG